MHKFTSLGRKIMHALSKQMLHAILAAFIFQEHLGFISWLVLDRTHLFFYFVQLLAELNELRVRFSLRMCLKLV